MTCINRPQFRRRDEPFFFITPQLFYELVYFQDRLITAVDSGHEKNYQDEERQTSSTLNLRFQIASDFAKISHKVMFGEIKRPPLRQIAAVFGANGSLFKLHNRRIPSRDKKRRLRNGKRNGTTTRTREECRSCFGRRAGKFRRFRIEVCIICIVTLCARVFGKLNLFVLCKIKFRSDSYVFLIVRYFFVRKICDFQASIHVRCGEYQKHFFGISANGERAKERDEIKQQ